MNSKKRIDDRIWYHDLDLFEQRFRGLIKRENLAITRLSEMTGISRDPLYAYHRGADLPPATILAILSEYFSVSIDYLLGISLEGETQVGFYGSTLKSLFPDLTEDQVSTLNSLISHYVINNRLKG